VGLNLLVVYLIAFFLLRDSPLVPPIPTRFYALALVAILVLLALLGTPLLAFVLRLLRECVRRRWGRVLGLLAGSAAVASGLAWWLVTVDVADMQPTEYYSAERWYAVWFLGVYAVGAVLLLDTAARWVGRRFRFTRAAAPAKLAPE
jgi:hypothetical protein